MYLADELLLGLGLRDDSVDLASEARPRLADAEPCKVLPLLGRMQTVWFWQSNAKKRALAEAAHKAVFGQLSWVHRPAHERGFGGSARRRCKLVNRKIPRKSQLVYLTHLCIRRRISASRSSRLA